VSHVPGAPPLILLPLHIPTRTLQVEIGDDVDKATLLTA
jgi:hypothetical protein